MKPTQVTGKAFKIVTVNEIQFDFMHDKETIDAIFIFKRLKKSMELKQLSCTCLL